MWTCTSPSFLCWNVFILATSCHAATSGAVERDATSYRGRHESWSSEEMNGFQGYQGNVNGHKLDVKEKEIQKEEKFDFTIINMPPLRSSFRRRRVESATSYSKEYDYNENHNVFDRHNDDVDGYNAGDDGHEAANYYQHTPSTKSSKSDKSTKGSKSSGKGKGKGGHDNYPPVNSPSVGISPITPTTPIMSTTPTTHPTPTVSHIMPPGTVPTRPRTEDPAPTTPSTDGCTPDSAGLYGSQLGFAEVTEYSYQVTTIPSVTAEDLDQFILPNVEDAMARGVLPLLFESCSISDAGSSSSSFDRGNTNNAPATSPPTPTALQGYILVGDTYVYQHSATSVTSSNEGYQKNRRQQRLWNDNRLLQSTYPPQQIEGMSTQPADQVALGVDCVDQSIPDLTCFVVRGSLTTYSREKQTDETVRYIQNVFETILIESTAELADADNQLLDVSYRDTTAYPLPDVTETPTGDESPTPTPVVRPDDKSSFGEPWQYALIAVGGCLILATVYLCLRKPKAKKIMLTDDEQNAENDESSASDEESADERIDDNHNEGVDVVPDSRVSSTGPTPDSSYQLPPLESYEDADVEAERHEIEYDEEGSVSEEDEVEEDEQMDDDGEWVGEDLQDEPSYDERLNDEPSDFGNAQKLEGPFTSLDDEETRRSFELKTMEDPSVRKALESPDSVSYAIARAMSQGAKEKSDTEFSPFDQIHDDNIYGATSGVRSNEYEFRNVMPMNSSHHAESSAAESSAASSDFEEVSVEEGDEDGEYEIEYETESDEESEVEEFESDEEN